MAYSYGAFNGHLCVGVQASVSPSAPSTSDDEVVVSTQWRVGFDNWNYSDSQELDYSGAISGHTDFDNELSGSPHTHQVLKGSMAVATKTDTVSLIYGATQTKTYRADLDGSYLGETPYKSITVTIPARPYSVPSAPTSVTATRTSDTSIGVAWTRHVSTGAPYNGQALWVSKDGAAAVLVANVSATATSATYAASANHKYVFTVRATNTAGTTTSAASNTILTTPAALASLSAMVVTSGTIRVTLPKRPTPYTEAQVVITETHDGGDNWNTKTTIDMADLSATANTTWDDTSAETGGVVQYRALVQTTGGTQGTLSSAYKTSNTITLNSPPDAPTNLAPSGAIDASNVVRLSWSHTASSDGAAQSSRKLEYSDDSGSSWHTIVSGNSTVQYYDWTPDLGDFTAGQTIVWRASTAGSQPGTYGAVSANQTLTLYGSLAVVLTADMPPTTHPGGPLTVAWTSSPTWGSTPMQTQYQVTMVDDASGATVYDTGSVSSDAETVDIPSTAQVNDRTYTVTVTLLDNHQITAVPVTASVTTDFLAPGPVELTWDYDDQTGTLTFYPTFSEESSSSLDDTVSWTLERSLDGDTWTPVGSVVTAAPISDYLARIGADSWYRSVGFTELDIAGDPTISAIAAADVQSRWGWLNFGEQYQDRVRFGWSQTVDIASGRASDTYDIEGVGFPVAVFGESLSDKYNIGGTLIFGAGIADELASSTGDDMRTMAKAASVCIFRDAHGAWFPARVTDMHVSPGRVMAGATKAGVSFAVERITS